MALIQLFSTGAKVFRPMKLDTTPISVFQDRTAPNGTRLAGWAALVRALDIAGPVRRPSCVSEQHVKGSRREEGAWAVYDKRYWPGDDFARSEERRVGKEGR